MAVVFSKRGIPVKEVSASRFQSVTDTTTSQGILAVFDTPARSLTKLYRPSYRKLLLCENIGDPGNLGTLIRSAAAFDFRLVCLIGACAEPYAPKVVRSSAGAIFAIAVVDSTDVEALALARSRSMRLVATDSTGMSDPTGLSDMVRESSVMMAVGSEAEGLSPGLLHAADLVVRLEHEATVDSLNAAVAGSILMKRIYDFTREAVT
ncbi:hypothetical protein GF420_05420 [candidate division GN15 bacterium]|nr:hypothetical protein [candidate division GN15 bacterium]